MIERLTADLRGDGYLGPGLLLDLFQVAALLPNQSTHQAVVGKDFQRDVLRPTGTQAHKRLDEMTEDWLQTDELECGQLNRSRCCCKPKDFFSYMIYLFMLPETFMWSRSDITPIDSYSCYSGDSVDAKCLQDSDLCEKVKSV